MCETKISIYNGSEKSKSCFKNHCVKYGPSETYMHI